MMKALIYSFILICSGSSLLAATISQFEGTYRLTQSEAGKKTFCFERIQISKVGQELGLFRTDISTDTPMYSAQVNGPKKAIRGSHGEALSSSKGTESVTLAGNTLTFKYSGTNKVIGVSVSVENDEYSFTLTQDKGTLQATRTFFEGATRFGARDVIKCTYSKE